MILAEMLDKVRSLPWWRCWNCTAEDAERICPVKPRRTEMVDSDNIYIGTPLRQGLPIWVVPKGGKGKWLWPRTMCRWKEKQLANKKILLKCDGASRGNPGRSAAAALLYEEDGTLVRVARVLPDGTNNVAEYSALILGLDAALKRGATDVDVRTDSDLLVGQVSGVYRTKDAKLRVLHDEVRVLVGKFSGFTIRHVGRERNVEVDSLVNRALDGFLGEIHEVVPGRKGNGK